MENIYLEEKYILEYIYNCIKNNRINGHEISNAKYHHNTNYENATSICQNGILSLNELNQRGIRKDNKELLEIMKDNESHVNGHEYISLAIVGLNDIYKNEEEYNPFSPYYVDFLVSSNIKTFRSSIHYGNEFLSDKSISKDKLKSVDIRLIELIEKEKNNTNEEIIIKIVNKYNCLKDIALEMIKQKMNIPLREMSESNIFELDIKKVANKPKILLKK